MNNILEKNIMVTVSMCGSDGRMSLQELFARFMDMAGEHGEEIRLGFRVMSDRGLFWLTVKTKIRIFRLPDISSRVTLRSWPGVPERVRCLRYYTMSAGDELLAEGKTEWAVLETATGKIHPLEGIYPEELQIRPETVCEGAFTRINPDFSGAELLGTYTVRSTDIDVGQHMNNAAYVRAMMSLFNTEEQKSLQVREAEALFRSPSFEGQELTFRRRIAEDGHSELCAVLPDGKPSFMAVLR